MTTNSRRRLVRDYKTMMLDPPVGVIARPEKDDLMSWQAVIFGPDDTAWEGGSFKLQMMFTEDYPSKAPKVKFITKLFHPNVYTDGAICLDILGSQWSPIYDVAAILTSIQSLLTDPNPNSPANVEAAKLYVENRREYDRKVAEAIEATWKLEAAEDGEDGEDEDLDGAGGEEKEDGSGEEGDEVVSAVEDADAAPRKKQKLTETTALPSNAKEPVSTVPAAASSSSSSSAAAAATIGQASSAATPMQVELPPAAAAAAMAAQ